MKSAVFGFKKSLAVLHAAKAQVRKDEQLRHLARACAPFHMTALFITLGYTCFFGLSHGQSYGDSTPLHVTFVLLGLLIHAPLFALMLAGLRKNEDQHALFRAAYQKAGGTISDPAQYPHSRRDNRWRFIGATALWTQPLLFFFFSRTWKGLVFYFLAHVLMTGFYMAWVLLAPYFEMRKMDYSRGRDYMGWHFISCTKLGLTASTLCLIPGLQFMYITAIIAGSGTLAASMEGVESASASPETGAAAPA